MVALSLVGLADDYLKIFKQRSTGIRARTKLLGQAVAALSFGYLAMQFPDEGGNVPVSNAISWVRDTDWILPSALVLLWIWFLVTGITNGVNLTDGLDGLAILPSVLIAGALGLIAYSMGNQIIADYLYLPHLELSGELIVFCGALIGSGIGFLWYNTYPAQIFMGDLGSLTLGGILGTLAVLVRHEIVFAIMAGVFVMETLSVIIQVGSYKIRGKRVFLMAPIHHHFELKGWAEPKVIVRFWIITFVLVLFALATLKLR